MTSAAAKNIDNLKAELVRQKELLCNIYQQNIKPNNPIFKIDFIFMGAINKALANISAFLDLIEKENYLVAFAIVRMQLDVMLRFYAAILLDIDSRIKYSDTFLAGERIDKLQILIKNEKGKNIKQNLTDKFLCKHFEKTFGVDWVLRVYKQTSNFVHLSGVSFLFMVNKTSKEGESIKVRTGLHKDGKIQIENEQLVDSFSCIVDITQRILDCLTMWLKEKEA